MLPWGRYEWTPLPQRAKVSPAVFSQVVNQIYHDARTPDGPILYVDDLTIASASFSEHIRHLELTLERARKYQLQFSFRKAAVVRKEVKILGSIIPVMEW